MNERTFNIAFVVTAAVLGAARWWIVRRRARGMRTDALSSFARAQGLSVTQGHVVLPMGRWQVILDATPSSPIIRIAITGPLPTGMVMRDGGYSTLTTAQSYGFGDVRVEGPLALTLAMLNSELRGKIEAGVKAGWTFDGGWHIEHSPGANPAASIDSLVDRGVALAEGLAEASDGLADRLKILFRDSYDEDERRSCLEVLADRFAGSKAYMQTMRLALADRAPGLRLMAASAINSSKTLATLISDESLASELRAEALDAACRNPLEGRVITLVSTLRHAIDALDVPLKLSVVRALRVVPNPNAEATLIELLDTAGTGELQREAVQTLAEIGTLACVRALIPLRDRAKGHLAVLARAAIQSIQARNGGGEEGSLALFEGEGALALSESEPTD